MVTLDQVMGQGVSSSESAAEPLGAELFDFPVHMDLSEMDPKKIKKAAINSTMINQY